MNSSSSSTCTIHRVPKNENFTITPNTLHNNVEISFKAKGILGYLLSKPDNWQTYISQLATASTDGRISVSSGIKELIKAGYIVKNAIRDNQGRFVEWQYHIYEDPALNSPMNPANTESTPQAENLQMGNHPLTSTDLSVKKNKHVFAPTVPTVEPVKPEKPKRKFVVVKFKHDLMNAIPENQRSSAAAICKQIHNKHGDNGLQWYIQYANGHKPRNYGGYLRTVFNANAYENYLNEQKAKKKAAKKQAEQANKDIQAKLAKHVQHMNEQKAMKQSHDQKLKLLEKIKELGKLDALDTYIKGHESCTDYMRKLYETGSAFVRTIRMKYLDDFLSITSPELLSI